jgi:2'-5' RNA ligase
VGIPLPPDARDEVTALVERVQAAMTLRSAGSGDLRPVRWVRMDGVHVTVRFLGPTPPERIESVTAALQAVAEQSIPFRVRLQGGGGFPRPDRPRTLWLRIDQGESDLAAFARRLDDRLARDGWPRETRPFRAHLTLARSDGVRAGPETLRLLMAEAQHLSVGWTADEAVLFESVTGGGPARYEPLARASFSATE